VDYVIFWPLYKIHIFYIQTINLILPRGNNLMLGLMHTLFRELTRSVDRSFPPTASTVGGAAASQSPSSANEKTLLEKVAAFIEGRRIAAESENNAKYDRTIQHLIPGISAVTVMDKDVQQALIKQLEAQDPVDRDAGIEVTLITEGPHYGRKTASFDLSGMQAYSEACDTLSKATEAIAKADQLKVFNQLLADLFVGTYGLTATGDGAAFQAVLQDQAHDFLKNFQAWLHQIIVALRCIGTIQARHTKWVYGVSNYSFSARNTNKLLLTDPHYGLRFDTENESRQIQSHREHKDDIYICRKIDIEIFSDAVNDHLSNCQTALAENHDTLRRHMQP
jgi:hypothetical protein